ncbi:LysE/ArgO family amino acid transporter [Nocardioides halotolerans]|uniref:LysE/ArgO family amino acid transporter n=1 Tax=Nocardioides halotolerans TaxID=433660 RepID=UPI00040B04A6|nr:LysE/ArgO family amino acid transporter [Nocardioides halotolerans]
MLDSAAAGLVTGLSLIIAIGAQNAFVLRQGLAREHVLQVVVICAVSDLVLILAGVAGIGTVIRQAGWVVDVVRWLGVAFLTWYGVTSLLRARRASALAAAAPEPMSRRSAALRVTALTWLNPHVYLDTVLLVGSIANTHGHGGRWWFAAGASVASVLWFGGLGFGARVFSPLLARPRAWQVLDVLIGLTMLAIAVMLALG